MPRKSKAHLISKSPKGLTHPMEPAGLAIGISALFQTAMACFACLRIAKSFGSDLQTYELRLAILHLRLSRWGKTIGLMGEVTDNSSPKTTSLDPNNEAIAGDLLRKIGTLFAAVENTAKELGEPSMDDSENHEPVKMLTRLMHNMSVSHMRISKKTKWVSYAKYEMSGLVDNLDKLISGLHDLFPAGAAITVTYCDKEANKLLDKGRNHPFALSKLEEEAAQLDTKLAEAIKHRKEQLAPASQVNNYNHNKAINIGSDVHGGQTNHVNFS